MKIITIFQLIINGIGLLLPVKKCQESVTNQELCYYQLIEESMNFADPALGITLHCNADTVLSINRGTVVDIKSSMNKLYSISVKTTENNIIRYINLTNVNVMLGQKLSVKEVIGYLPSKNKISVLKLIISKNRKIYTYKRSIKYLTNQNSLFCSSP